ncbi:MAG TPA: hypothetical protein VJ179_04035 [Patescibacteria group bacterium]|nr:hypothetical protein [Patescibacteria group bacterium]
MILDIAKRIARKKSALFFLALFLYIFVTWWPLPDTFEEAQGLPHADFYLYMFVGTLGALNGFRIAFKWGGLKSKLGKGIFFLSAALLSQDIGGFIWLYFNKVFLNDLPYPGLPDIGYFGVIPLSVIALLNFADLAGTKFSLRTVKGVFTAVGIALVMIITSYVLFLKDVQPDFQDPIRTFLDFGYPLGEALVFALALIVYTLTTKTLGGAIRTPMIFMIGTFFILFLSDYTFAYTAGKGTYYDGNWVDMLYATYGCMTSIALILFEDLEEQKT